MSEHVTEAQLVQVQQIAEAHWKRGYTVNDDVSPLQVLGLLGEVRLLQRERDKARRLAEEYRDACWAPMVEQKPRLPWEQDDE